MNRVSSHFPRIFLILTLTTLLISAAAWAQSQSLGDLARENREKKAEETTSAAPPRVITNSNLPKDPDAISIATDGAQGSATTEPRQREDRQAARQRATLQRAEMQWRAKILQQKNTVANLRARVDQLKASIRFADPNHYYSSGSPNYDYYAGLNYNGYQARQLQRLAQLQEQLDQQKKKLEELQEAARHAGMHTQVYDP